MTTSIRSTALEPRPDDSHDDAPLVTRVSKMLGRALPQYGLVVIMFALIILFSFLKPDTFATLLNFRLIVSGKAVLFIAALAATIPMIAGKIDLSIGAAIGLWHVLALTFQIRYGFEWWQAVLLVIVGGAILGLLNGLLVELAQVDAFIATLGTGTVVQAITEWHTDGTQQVDRDQVIPDMFFDLSTWTWGDLPVVGVYVIVIAVLLWIATEYLPLGRYLYAIGANPRAAELNGINRRKLTILSFVISGILVALAGILFASRLRVGQANAGNQFLLPALVGAFLGSTTIRPGRVNIWGTVVGIAVGAIGISGIQQFGSEFWVEPLFNGLTLVAAITIASWAGRRRLNSREVVAAAPKTGSESDGPDTGGSGGPKPEGEGPTNQSEQSQDLVEPST